MTATLTGYKVVRVGRYVSGGVEYFLPATTFADPDIRYYVGRVTERGNVKSRGPFAVFASLYDARMYVYAFGAVNGDTWHRIYKCEYTPSRARRFWYHRIEGGIEGGRIYTGIVSIPSETVYADTVKLLEEVSSMPPFQEVM